MGEKVIATNRKARHDYNIHETFEAGISLVGTEVKSLRDGRANLRESYAVIDDGEVYMVGVHISPYTHGTTKPHDPKRKRKLLLHRGEIHILQRHIEQKGFTLVPLKLYFKEGKAKVELALVSGKKQYDRRREIAERDAKRQMTFSRSA